MPPRVLQGALGARRMTGMALKALPPRTNPRAQRTRNPSKTTRGRQRHAYRHALRSSVTIALGCKCVRQPTLRTMEHVTSTLRPSVTIALWCKCARWPTLRTMPHVTSTLRTSVTIAFIVFLCSCVAGSPQVAKRI